jgi:hypothetical protein
MGGLLSAEFLIEHQLAKIFTLHAANREIANSQAFFYLSSSLL